MVCAWSDPWEICLRLWCGWTDAEWSACSINLCNCVDNDSSSFKNSFLCAAEIPEVSTHYSFRILEFWFYLEIRHCNWNINHLAAVFFEFPFIAVSAVAYLVHHADWAYGIFSHAEHSCKRLYQNVLANPVGELLFKLFQVICKPELDNSSRPSVRSLVGTYKLLHTSLHSSDYSTWSGCGIICRLFDCQFIFRSNQCSYIHSIKVFKECIFHLFITYHNIIKFNFSIYNIFLITIISIS